MNIAVALALILLAGFIAMCLFAAVFHQSMGGGVTIEFDLRHMRFKLSTVETKQCKNRRKSGCANDCPPG